MPAAVFGPCPRILIFKQDDVPVHCQSGKGQDTTMTLCPATVDVYEQCDTPTEGQADTTYTLHFQVRQLALWGRGGQI